MRSRKSLAFAYWIFVVMFVLSMPWRVQAQDNSSPSTMLPLDRYMMDRNAEIAMARSAGPNSISSRAKVLVLGRHGYETAVEGKNGYVCLVGRSWDLPSDNPAFWNPKIHGPVCLNAAAARSDLQTALKKTELALAGDSSTQINDAITDAFAKGELHAPEAGSMAYMMSKQGYLNAKIKGPWLPHVMFYVPEIDPKALGTDQEDVPLNAHEDKAGHYTIIDVPVSKWSDGTPADVH